MTKKYNRWDDKQINELKELIIMDAYTNECLNYDELAEHFKIAVPTIWRRIIELRKVGELPKVDKTIGFDKFGTHYSEREISQVISMSDANYSKQEIADTLGRTKKSIDAVQERLRKQGKLKYRFNRWSPEEDAKLLDMLEFDSNNIISNTKHIAYKMNRSRASIEHRIFRLREQHLIPKPTRPGASDEGVKRWIENKQKILDWVFQKKK